jgi:hypothetical protein
LERGPLAQVAAMEEDFQIVLRPDEAMSLSEHERDDAAGARRAAAFRPRVSAKELFPDSGRAASGHRLIADATAADAEGLSSGAGTGSPVGSRSL